MFPRPYRGGPIEPVCQVGQNLLLHNAEGYALYQVAFIEPLFPSWPFIFNLAVNPALAIVSIGAGLSTANQSLTTLLDLNYGQLGHFRVQVLDDISVVLSLPQAVQRGAVKNVTTRLTPFLLDSDPDGHLAEFFSYEDDRAFMIATNPRAAATTLGRVRFTGFRYVLAGKDGLASAGNKLEPIARYANVKDAENGGYNYTAVNTGGWPK